MKQEDETVPRDGGRAQLTEHGGHLVRCWQLDWRVIGMAEEEGLEIATWEGRVWWGPGLEVEQKERF